MTLTTILIAWLGLQIPVGSWLGRRLKAMSTPVPVPAAPSFWHALGAALEHDALTIAVAPIRAGLALFKAAKADPVKISLAIVQTQATLMQVAPTLAAAIEGDVIDALDAQLAKVQPSTPATPAS